MTGRVVQIFDETDPLRSDTTLLVAALLTLGIPKAGRDLFSCTVEHERGETKFRAAWTLAGQSADGRFDTDAMEARWADGVWLLQNPAHPMAILRGGLTFHRALHLSPRFTPAELARIETPDTWIEAGARNLVCLLREMPLATPEMIVRFRRDHAAFVPVSFSEPKKSRLIKYVEHPARRSRLAAAA